MKPSAWHSRGKICLVGVWQGRSSCGATFGPLLSSIFASADRVSATAQGRVDLRTQSLIQARGSLVMFAYVATFLLRFTYRAQVAGAKVFNAGPMYANILLIPSLARNQLLQHFSCDKSFGRRDPLVGEHSRCGLRCSSSCGSRRGFLQESAYPDPSPTIVKDPTATG